MSRDRTLREFVQQDVDATMRTMLGDPTVVHVPTATGGRGRDGVRTFSAAFFVGRNPQDFQISLMSRTVGVDLIVEEMLVPLTHDIEVPWLLPGVPPTGRRIEIPVVAVVGTRDGLSTPSTYWDQASVLAQVGLLDIETLPALDEAECRPLVDRNARLNTLLDGR